MSVDPLKVVGAYTISEVAEGPGGPQHWRITNWKGECLTICLTNEAAQAAAQVYVNCFNDGWLACVDRVRESFAKEGVKFLASVPSAGS